MGMFDSLYGANGADWQTKALGRQLRRYEVGSAIPGPPVDYQLEVLGGHTDAAASGWAYATVRDGVLSELPVGRDPGLALLSYAGAWSPRDEAANRQPPPSAATRCTHPGCSSELVNGYWGDRLAHEKDGTHTVVTFDPRWAPSGEIRDAAEPTDSEGQA